MMIPQPLMKINKKFDDWLSAPTANAAGRSGLFRIIFALFYLWHLSPNYAAILSDFPGKTLPLKMIMHIPRPLPPYFFETLESVLVAALIVLLIGYRVQCVTVFVIVVGCLLDAFSNSFDMEAGTVFMVFYIPLFMLIIGGWGETYSLDAYLRKRKHIACIEPSNSSGYYYVPARCVLIVLSILFLGAAISKTTGAGTWMDQPRFMADLMLEDNIISTFMGLPLNYLAPMISESPILYHSARYAALLFEGTFFLALFSRKLRNIYIPLALIFHAVNALWLIVTFTPILIVYLMFVDWQALLNHTKLKRITIFDSTHSKYLITATLGLALMAGALWNQNDTLRSALNLGGLLDWRTIWYPVLPIAVFFFFKALYELFGSILRKPGLQQN